MKKIISAGGIIVRDNPNKQILLMIFTHIKGLGFPKGHVKTGESLEQAAMREVTEETGLVDLKIIKKLGIINRAATEKDGTPVLKDIHMYLITSEKPNFHQEADELYDWFDIDDAVKQMAIPEDAEFIKNIIDNI
ncbi:MAG TPA: NUDIX domain-containing protein [Patescibacteria group bacterium]|nr:NUDIX domain-containing protein [Patescibacteria group bacterium]